MKRTARPLTPSQQRAREALCEVVRSKLMTLGDFGHLQLRREREHVLIEQPGPPDDPEDRFAVLRLTPIGGFRFGLSLARHTGRWEKLPIAGVLTDVLEQAVAMLGPWLAPQHGIVSETSGTDN
jgi:hypothetical protein